MSGCGRRSLRFSRIFFFQKRVHRITCPAAVQGGTGGCGVSYSGEQKKPLLIVGGGVRFSEAGEVVEKFCEEFGIPFGETQGGKVPAAPVIHTAFGGIRGNRNPGL